MTPTLQSRGFALVLTLALLVLVAGLVTAYFSRALQESRVGDSSRASVEVRLLSESAINVVLDDFQSELRAGSEPDFFDVDDGGFISRVWRPIPVPSDHEAVFALAPSIIPQPSPALEVLGLPGVLKISRFGSPFFDPDQEGYRDVGDPPDRVSPVSTHTPSLNGRGVARESWRRPQLLAEAEFDQFQSPDWIYINRVGLQPEGFTPQEFASMSGAEAGNDEFVLGRFAYVVYDVGGLIDINVAGHAVDLDALTVSEKDDFAGRRGRLAQVSLDQGIGEVEMPDFDAFVSEWRSPLNGIHASRIMAPDRALTSVEVGEQAFVTRQELIRYAEQISRGVVPASLPFLTIYSRDVDAPHWEPNPWRPTDELIDPWDSEVVDPEIMNRSLLEVRFTGETELLRGGDSEVVVPAGTPVMPRRFPLNKLGLLEDPNPDAAALDYYFGLEKVDNQIATYRYVKDIDGRIAKLDEVAALGREPNLFEILQAVIHTGSLGKHGGNTATFDWLRDRLRNLQIMQIGANIIDQWDSDDIPTTLLFPAGEENDWLEVYGVENLPYFHQFAWVPMRPVHNRDLFQVWALFDVWNPHQNAADAGRDITQFRIVPVSGQARVSELNYLMRTLTGANHWNLFRGRVEPGSGFDTSQGDPRGDLDVINRDGEGEIRPLAFSLEHSFYAEVETVGGEEPETAEAWPGLLVLDLDMNETPRAPIRDRPTNPLVPEKEWMHEDKQIAINDLWLDNPDVAYNASHGSIGTNQLGHRLYPEDTEFTNFDSDFWTIFQNSDDEWEVYGNFGIKGAHIFRLRPEHATYNENNLGLEPDSWVPESALNFELQAYVDGEFGGPDWTGGWVTYQRIDDWHSWSNTMVPGREDQRTREEREVVLSDSHHSMVPEEELSASHFYRWREGPMGTHQKVDPRTQRFGHGMIDSGRARLGRPIRSSLEALDPDGNGWNVQRSYGGRVAGKRSNFDPVEGFEFWNELDERSAAAAGLMTNHPDRLDGAHPMRYASRDGVIRPGDAYFGMESGGGPRNVPTAPGRFGERPVILNRPFHSPGDLGYVFRDEPWKTLDFFSRYSADLGLLDVFSFDEPAGERPLASGKVNLNTVRPEVLAALLVGTSKQLAEVHPDVSRATLTAEEAEVLAEAIVVEARENPFVSIGDIVPRVLHRAGESPLFPETVVKAHREAAVRTLAALGTTRTWNLMLDLVVQSGRFTTASKDASDFLVTGEARYWVHVAIDRITGEIIDFRKEAVHE